MKLIWEDNHFHIILGSWTGLASARVDVMMQNLTGTVNSPVSHWSQQSSTKDFQVPSSMVVDNRVPLDYLPAAPVGVCAAAHTPCYTSINTQQVELETIKLLKLAKCLKGHSSFTTSATDWLRSKALDIFSWLSPELRTIIRSGLQIILRFQVSICLIDLIVKQLTFFV